MTPHAEAPPVIVLRLTDPERAFVTKIMQRLRAAWGRHVEPSEAVKAVLDDAAKLAA